MKQVRSWGIGGMVTAAVGVFMGAAAWACVSGPVTNLSTISAKPGQEVTVTGTGFQTGNQAIVRWNALDGPVLATMAPPITGGNLSATFTVPQDAKPGSYVVIVSQTRADGSLSLSPVRSVMSVTGEAGTAPVLGAPAASADTTTARANGLARSDDSISTGTLALVALGVGGVGMFLAGMAALFAGRRSSAPEVAKARS